MISSSNSIPVNNEASLTFSEEDLFEENIHSTISALSFLIFIILQIKQSSSSFFCNKDEDFFLSENVGFVLLLNDNKIIVAPLLLLLKSSFLNHQFRDKYSLLLTSIF